jgi:hypothetical protein
MQIPSTTMLPGVPTPVFKLVADRSPEDDNLAS